MRKTGEPKNNIATTTDKRLRVYLGLPNYDLRSFVPMYDTVGQCFSDPSKASTAIVKKRDYAMSALCFNYNTLWCEFMNLHRQKDKDGRPVVEAFAMLHNDLEVTGHPYWKEGRSWLDWMWDKMQEKDLTCLSVVNAIKSREGATSVAMGSGKHRQRRLLFSEIANLPPTFDSDEFYSITGETLLINTGIMLIKPDPIWMHEFQFEFLDKIGTDSEGNRIPLMFPEDWQMSRFFHAHNVKYAATTEVKTNHWGTFPFPNHNDGSGLYLPPEE